MEIKGPGNFSRYDPQHIAVVQREIAHSVKPNVLKQLDEKDITEEELERLFTEDLVDLSPEAKDLLRRLRKERKGKGRHDDDVLDSPRKDFLSLLAGLEEFRRQVESEKEGDERDKQDEEGRRKPPPKPKPFVPPIIALSTHVPRPELSPAQRASAISHNHLNKAGDLARKMVAISPRPELKETFALEIQVFGEAVISQVKQYGVRVVVLSAGMALTDLKINGMHVVAPSEKTFDGRPWGVVRGLSCPDRRMLVLGEERLGLADRSTARHEFAHAYDHVFSQKNHRKLPLSVQLFNSFRKERTGLVSDYAATNPAEFFAESVEAFFQPGAQRERLRSSDPLMFNYLVELFES